MSLLSLPLPVEIELIVLHYLSWPELVRCRRVCKHLQSLIDSDPYFRLIIELGAAGCVDNPDSDEPPARKAELLTEHGRAFSCMHWRARRMTDPSDNNRKARIINGVYARLCDNTDPEANDYWPVNFERDETWVFFDVLTNRRVRDDDWRVCMAEFNCIMDEFAMDFSKDLLIGVKQEQNGYAIFPTSLQLLMHV